MPACTGERQRGPARCRRETDSAKDWDGDTKTGDTRACRNSGRNVHARDARAHARGCAFRQTSSNRASSTLVYRCVVDRLACPSRSWIERRSAPPASRCVAKECRRACGVACSGSPFCRRYKRKVRCATAASSRFPRAPRNSGASGRAAGMQPQPRGDRLAHHRQHRNDAFFRSFADHAQRAVIAWPRRIAHVQRQRLGDAQAAAIQQREQRRVARLDRGLIGHFADILGHAARRRRRQRPRQRPPCLRRRTSFTAAFSAP